MNQSDWYAKLLEWSHKDSRLGRLPYVLMVVLAEHLAEHEAAEHTAHLTALRRGLAVSILCNVVLLAVVCLQ